MHRQGCGGCGAWHRRTSCRHRFQYRTRCRSHPGACDGSRCDWRRPLPRWLILLWNATGQILLIVVAAVAFAASPVFRAFGDDQLNVWVTQFPYVWIAVMVAAALFGHVVTLRKVLSQSRAKATALPAAAIL